VSQPVGSARGTWHLSTRVQGIYNDLQRMSRGLPQIGQSCDLKARRIFLTGPAKHGVAGGDVIRSPASRLTVSRVAAVNSERQSLIWKAITARGGWETPHKRNIERCLKLELWSNAVHRRTAPSSPSGSLSPLEQHPLLTGFALPRLRTRMHRFNLWTSREKGEGIIHKIDDLILRVPNVERKCALTCLVSHAQDRPLERVGVEVNVCRGRANQSNERPSYIMAILLGRATNHITDQVKQRKVQQQPSQNVCNRPSVRSLGCCPVHMGLTDKSWRAE
jgi:hypothetical protein